MLLLLMHLALVLSPPASAAEDEIEFDRVEETTIHFKAAEGSSAPKPVKTGLYDLTYKGRLRPPQGAPNVPPYFLFSGRTCKDCQEDTGLFAIRPNGGRREAFLYPGKILEPRSREVVYESQAFVGRCLAKTPNDVYVVFQKERIDRKKRLQSSVLVIQPDSDHLNEKLIERRAPDIRTTLRYVKSKSCQAIEGRNRIMPVRPILSGTRRSIEEPTGPEDDEAERAPTSSSDEAPEPSPAP